MAAQRIRSIDMRLIDDLFGMGGGFVLDFSDRTFAAFFIEELDIDIDHASYCAEGTSKAKRLRYFLHTSDTPVRIKALLALWEYRERYRRRNRREETIPGAEEEFRSLIERLGGQVPSARHHSNSSAQTSVALDAAVSKTLLQKLLSISTLSPQTRGYAYEGFLREVFDAHGLLGRASFRLVGEQIDGSFELASETYLLEAKWTSSQVGVSELRSFNGKVEEKAAWTRGLFVSDSGFTTDGLEAFGRGKRVICMDGLDLWEMLHRNLSFADVLARKVRRAAESGNPFVRVRDLF